MLDTEPLRAEAAREFAAQHWPTHNRSQGFQWEQGDFALGAFDALECMGVAIYRVVGASHCADRRAEHQAKDGKIAVR